MNLHDMIYQRKSVRKYRQEPVDIATLQKIEAFCAMTKPLYPEIRVRAEIVNRENVKSILPWITPQVIAVFSEQKDGYLENVGFLFQQLELYLQTLGLGACWIGMGRLDTHAVADKNDGLQFVILLTFGFPKEELHRDTSAFRRKALSEIADTVDERLEPARLAPSSVNNQPWYFVHEGDVIHAYCVKQGMFKTKTLGEMHLIDMGIALAHMYVANADTFRFFKDKQVKERKGYGYVGSFTLS